MFSHRTTWGNAFVVTPAERIFLLSHGLRGGNTEIATLEKPFITKGCCLFSSIPFQIHLA